MLEVIASHRTSRFVLASAIAAQPDLTEQQAFFDRERAQVSTERRFPTEFLSRANLMANLQPLSRYTLITTLDIHLLRDIRVEKGSALFLVRIPSGDADRQMALAQF